MLNFKELLLKTFFDPTTFALCDLLCRPLKDLRVFCPCNVVFRPARDAPPWINQIYNTNSQYMSYRAGIKILIFMMYSCISSFFHFYSFILTNRFLAIEFSFLRYCQNKKNRHLKCKISRNFC